MCYLYILAVPINACGITKKEEESSEKGHICGFLPFLFPDLGYLERCTPPLNDVFLQLLVENKEFYFSKRALRGGTAHHNWLK